MPRIMNGDEPKIEIFKPFGEAFELMKKILFQPFDLKKWCVIGFAAFLASLSGGMHFNFNGFNRKPDWHWKFSSMRHNVETSAGHMPDWFIPFVIVLVLFFLALVVVLMWVGARGRFMFIDCIVHNRGAIKAPWHEFRAEGNSFFLFSLLVALIFLLVLALALFALFLPKILHADTARLRPWLIAGLISIVALVIMLALGWNWISQLMVPVMYRKRCRAFAAFRDVLGLISNYPAPLILYFLFLIVLAMASIIIGCVTACLTCCVAVIPYVGTVILLPLHVLLYGFTLLFLRQFGNEYDVWTRLIPAMEAEPPIPPPLQA